MRTLWISLLAVSLLVAIAPTTPAKTDSIRVPYQGPAITGHTTLAEDCSGEIPRSLGVVCFELPKGSHSLTFAVDDKSGSTVGGSYYIYDTSGAYYTSGTHCGPTTTPTANGGFAIVRLDAVGGPSYCLSIGETPGEATKGDVHFALR